MRHALPTSFFISLGLINLVETLKTYAKSSS
jgi:hypothetical protein